VAWSPTKLEGGSFLEVGAEAAPAVLDHSPSRITYPKEKHPWSGPRLSKEARPRWSGMHDGQPRHLCQRASSHQRTRLGGRGARVPPMTMGGTLGGRRSSVVSPPACPSQLTLPFFFVSLSAFSLLLATPWATGLFSLRHLNALGIFWPTSTPHIINWRVAVA
jgi:hypothetical protein